VACVEDGDCGQGVCGDDYTCVGCARHEDCPGTACDLEQRECLSTSAVFWVDPSGCGPPGPPAQDTGFGTPGQPYCWLGTALDNFPAVNKGVIFVTQGSAEPIEEDISIDTLGAVTIAVMGIDTPTIVGATTPAVVGGGATVYLHNLRLEEDAGGNGATCGGFGKLWITDVRVEGSNHAGIAADSCERLTVERSIIFGNRQGGISAAGSTVVMMSSALVQNGFAGGSTSALSANNSDLDIRYTTFAGNLGSINGAASLSCTNSTGELRNSIVTAPAAPSFDCPGLSVRTSAVDTELDDGDGVVTLPMYDASLFEALPARDVAPANPDDSPFADVAVWDVGDPLRDLGGPRRLAFPGRREFAGAVQP
jgi:hypothetical protein